MAPRYAVGIDLGTTHTVVAYAELASPTPRTFALPQLVSATEVAALPLLPSCLYAPTDAERQQLPGDPEDPYRLGRHAQRRGAEVPGRLVSSAKSWLGHGGVDRHEAILPWGADEGGPRLSPVDAAARVLRHVRARWDEAFAGDPLAGQEIVLTVPASFDAAARELTIEAITQAGLAHVTLLEEPQAAFHDWMHRQGDAGLEALLADRPRATVLVCDVGGGTTDLTLIEVARAGEGLRVQRLAVGDHLLLGGDNMDLALAHFCEPRLSGEGAAPGKLSPARFAQLVASCRAAKELLLSEDAPEETTVTLLGEGSRLLGATRRTTLRRDDVERLILDGFLPLVPLDSEPARGRAGLVSFGLPYARDAAISRHLAHFLRTHGPAPEVTAVPTAVVLNGGVFHAHAIASRLGYLLGTWFGAAPRLLPYADPDLAVARGAVVYALAQRGLGRRIGGGSPRAYYVGLGDGQVMCLVPRGSEPSVVHRPTPQLALVVGAPARFELFASSEARTEPVGGLRSLGEDLVRLPPIATTIAASSRAEVPVRLEAELTEIGTLEVSCVEQQGQGRRFRLAFQLRAPVEAAPARSSTLPPPSSAWAPRAGSTRPPPASIGPRRLDEARLLVDRVFGKATAREVGREAKDLLRDLEKTLGDRAGWTVELGRELCDLVLRDPRARRRSPDHERVFWQLAGYTLRPGLGHPADPERIATLLKLWPESVTHKREARVWQQYWIAWRRVAAGLDDAAQTAIRATLDPFLRPDAARAKGPRPEALDDLLALACWLERAPLSRKQELGEWLRERTWTRPEDGRLWEGLGRLGVRVPVYASAHQILPPRVVEPWLDELLRQRWEAISTAPLAAARLARLTGDRARDVSDRLRREVLRRLEAGGARAAWIEQVREVVVPDEAEQADDFGESLPVGLRLASS